MSDLFTTITVAVVTNGAVLGLFIWVFKVSFEKVLEKRARLFEKEIELINQKNFYQFSKTYDEQATAAKEVYADLVVMMDDVAYLAYSYDLLERHPELFEQYRKPKDGDPIKWDRFLKATLSERKGEVKAKELSDHVSRALRAFKKKRIYFAGAVAAEIERLMNLVLFVASDFSNVTYRDPDEFKPVIAEEVIKLWIQAVQVSHELFPKLEAEFRAHLGIKDNDTEAAVPQKTVTN